MKDMHIDSYRFGNIVVDGKSFDKDLIIFPDRIIDNWWRKEGHMLQLADLEEVVEFMPEVLVVGTGDTGMMKIAEEVIERMKHEGIQMIAYKNKDAVRIFNESKKKKVGAFHLTC